jgi:hypothetical protein
VISFKVSKMSWQGVSTSVIKQHEAQQIYCLYLEPTWWTYWHIFAMLSFHHDHVRDKSVMWCDMMWCDVTIIAAHLCFPIEEGGREGGLRLRPLNSDCTWRHRQ